MAGGRSCNDGGGEGERPDPCGLQRRSGARRLQKDTQFRGLQPGSRRKEFLHGAHQGQARDTERVETQLQNGLGNRSKSTMRPMIFLSMLLLVGAASAPVSGSRGVVVSGPGGEIIIADAELENAPRVRLAVSIHGEVHEFEGVPVATLLERVAPPIERLKAEALAQVVLASARDRYRVAFGLADFDRTISKDVIILADRKDGAKIGPKDGPWLIVEGDARGARSVRMVERIDIIAIERD